MTWDSLYLPVLMLIAYWQAPHIVPYVLRFARRSILVTAALMLPANFFTFLIGYVGPSGWKVPLDVAAFVGLFVAFSCAGIALVLDARRGPLT